jgi:hypothetical protein
MATINYTATLDGVTDFLDEDGNTEDWGGGGYIGFLNFHDGGSGNTLNATLNLTGTNWDMNALRFSGGGTTNVTITDLDSGSGRRIDYIRLGDTSVVTLDSTRVKYIEGRDGPGSSHDITLGSASTRSIDLFSEQTRVTTGTGWVGNINTGDGEDTVTTNGDVGRIGLGNGDDRIYVESDNVDFADLGRGDDRLIVRNDGRVGSANLWDGDNLVIARHDARIDFVKISNSTNDVQVRNDAAIYAMDLYNSTNMITLYNNGRINALKMDDSTNMLTSADGFLESIAAYNSTNTFTIGAGGAGQIHLAGNMGQMQTINAIGYIDQLQVFGNLVSNMSFGDSGSGRVRLGDGNDTVATGTGHVEFLTTRDGDDDISIGTGGANTVRTGDGNDTVGTDGWVELISTGDGNDHVTIGSAGSGHVRTGDGDDTVVLHEFDNWYYGVTISMSGGFDTLDFSNFSVGVTFTLDSIGIWQNPGAPGGDIDLEATGFVSETGIDALIGTDHADALTGDHNGNLLEGGKGNDALNGLDGDDTLDGGTANDTVYGGDGHDEIFGDGGKDRLFGGTGDDTITGGRGDDRMKGNGGEDVFVFGANAGTDRIESFQDGQDLLEIADHAGGFGSLTITDTGKHINIDHDGGRIILLQMSGTVLTADDFNFV